MTGGGLPFALLYSVRSSWGRHRVATALTIIAVCTSVALATALELSSRSVEAQLQATATVLAGAAEIEVTGGALGVSDSLVEDVQEVEGVALAVPYVQTTFRVIQEPIPGAALYVLGIDLVRDQSLRTYALDRDPLRITDPLGLVGDMRSVLVTRSFAERLGVGPGDSVHAEREGQRYELVIRGLLERGGVAEAFGGSIAVMDVYLLQTLLGRQGWLDRVDVVAAEEAGLQEVMDRISERIGGVASVRRAAARDEWVDRTMATVRTITFSLAAIETIVAALLVFGTMSLAVDRRARELALLRSVGFEPGRARRLVHVDALVVGLLAILAGFPLGVALSRVFLPLLSRVSAYLQDVHIEPGAVSAVTTGVAILVGLLVAQVGTYLPALRTAEASPLVVMRGEQRGREVLWPGAAWWIASLVLGAGWLALGTSSFGLPPLVRVGLIFAIGVAFLASASVRILPPLLRAGRGLLERVIPRVGRLAGASLASRARDSGVTMAAVSGVLAGLTTVLVMVESLAWTLDHWIATEYRNAVLVTAGSPFAGRDRELVRHETTRTVRDVEGVRAVSELFTANILYRGEEVLLVGQSAAVLERYGELPAIGSSPAELARALKRGETAVSDAFADHFGVKAGQSITLYTPKGPRTLRVAGYFRDYVGPAGSIQVDIGVLDELWPREGSYLLAVWVDSPASSAIERIREAIGDRQELFFIHGADLDHYAGNVLRQLTHLMTQVAFLTALLGGIAVTNLLVAAVTERRREILLIRSAGATNGQLTTLVLVDAALLALPGAGVGIAVGLACAYPMVTDVLREAFGWSVTFRVAPLKIVTLFAEVIAAAVLAGLYPAWLGRHLLPRDAFAPE